LTIEQHLATLTEPQLEAATHVDGPLLMLAGPGSGKTRVVTHRIAYLLSQGIAARQILALTFTNKAADEMRLRVESIAPDKPVWMGTFHRFCARLLRQHAALAGLGENYTIFDSSDSLRALKQAIARLDLDLTHFTPQSIGHAISSAKNSLITSDTYQARPGHPLGALVAKIYPAYQRRLLESNAVDFDDLLLHVVKLLQGSPELRATLDEHYRYIMVDEYQDTNLAQYAIVRALSVDYPNLAVTGDPDQSIYGWRGANLNNILDFEKDYPDVRVVRLEQNYRSTPNILSVADQLISNNKRRKQKALFTHNDSGQPVRLTRYADQRDESESIVDRIVSEIEAGTRRASDYAIFYRVNALSRSLEFALRDRSVPYQIVNGVEFFQRKEIKDILAYVELQSNLRNDVAFMRIVNMPPRGIGKTTLERLSAHAHQYGVSLLQASREAGMIETLNKRATSSLAKFVALVDSLGEASGESVEEILGLALEESGYQDYLKKSDTEEDHQRLANIQELLTVGRQFDEENLGDNSLEAFLEQASLVNDTDAWEDESDRVTLMTLHAAKGLEFPVVYIVAVEDGLLPHERSKDSPDQLEEERRLLFVGITRAEQELQLSGAKYRDFRGQRLMTVPSRFLMELPRDEMDCGDADRVPFGVPDWVTDDFSDGDPGDDFSQEVEGESFSQDETPQEEVFAEPGRFGAAGCLGSTADGGRFVVIEQTAWPCPFTRSVSPRHGCEPSRLWSRQNLRSQRIWYQTHGHGPVLYRVGRTKIPPRHEPARPRQIVNSNITASLDQHS